jgi:retron-type reverse transcriptase
MAVVAEHSTVDQREVGADREGGEPRPRGPTDREGEARQNVLLGGTMEETPSSQTISTNLQRIAKQVVDYPGMVFTTLAYLIDVELLREAYERTRKDASPGMDGVTAKEYAVNLEANLTDLYERLHSGRYFAPPVVRKFLDKEEGSKRPIGLPAFEDKIVQRAVAMLLGAIYEQDFYDFSHGFREGHSAHQALHELREQCMSKNINWIVDADVTATFDSLDWDLLMEVIKRRVNDGGILRLIGKWLNAGVLEDETLTYPEKGPPQGGVIKRETAGKRLRWAMKRVWQWCCRNRHEPLVEQYRTLGQKLRGHYQYYGIRGNYRKLEALYKKAEKAWRYWLSHWSTQGAIPWEKYKKLKGKFPLPRPSIVHNI